MEKTNNGIVQKKSKSVPWPPRYENLEAYDLNEIREALVRKIFLEKT